MTADKVKKNIAFSTCYQILIMLSPLITAPYIARVLGVSGIGIYSYASSCQYFLALFAVMGTTSYGMRTISQARDSKEKYSRLFWEIEIMTVITSSVCIALWLGFAVTRPQYMPLYLILTLNLVNTMFDITWFYAGMELFRYTVTVNGICKILGIILQFTLVKSKEDLYIYALVIMTTTLAGTLSLWVPAARMLSGCRIKLSDLGPHFVQTLIYFIPAIATSVYTILDKVLLGIITESEYENGYYEQATKIINALKALTFSSLNLVLGSRISYLFAKRDLGEVKSKIRTSMDFILYMGIGFCSGLIAVAGSFVPLFFGKDYAPAIPLLRLMSPLIVIIGISSCLGSQYYVPSGKRKQSAGYIVAGAAVNLVLNLIMIPSLKSVGAVLATLVAESLITVLYLTNAKGYVSYKALFPGLIKKLFAAAVMFAIISIPERFLGEGVQALVIQIVTGPVIYALILHILKDSMQLEFEKLLHLRH